jgi:hypothetical protein
MSGKASATKEFTMQEREVPKQISWNAPGDVVAGVLIEVTTIEKDGKRIPRFVVHDPDEDRLYSFLGTYDISQKLMPGDRGKYIEVSYVGENPDVSKAGNAMKVFRVAVSKEKAASVPSLGITDADIPF